MPPNFSFLRCPLAFVLCVTPYVQSSSVSFPKSPVYERKEKKEKRAEWRVGSVWAKIPEVRVLKPRSVASLNRSFSVVTDASVTRKRACGGRKRTCRASCLISEAGAYPIAPFRHGRSGLEN